MEDVKDVILGVHHVGLTVADEDAAVAFYARAAAFQTLAENAQPQVPLVNGVARGTFMRSANAYLRVIGTTSKRNPAGPVRPVSDAGIVHICLQSTQVESLYGNFETAGATFHAPLVDLGTGFLYSYARDIEANVVELEGVSPVWDDPAPWIAHVSFSTANIERLSEFYATAFCQPAIRSPRLGPNKRFDAISGLSGTEFQMAWIPAGNMQIEVIQYLQPATKKATLTGSLLNAGYSYVCFEVADLRGAMEHLRAAGATQSADQAAVSGTNQVFCADPDGNTLLLNAIQSGEEAFAISALPDPDIVSRFSRQREKLKGRVNSK